MAEKAWRFSSEIMHKASESCTITAHTSQHSLGVLQCCASIMHRVIFSNLGVTNPPAFLIQPGGSRKERQVSPAVGSLWMVRADPAGCRVVGSGDHVHHHHASLHSGSSTAAAFCQPSQDVSCSCCLCKPLSTQGSC